MDRPAEDDRPDVGRPPGHAGSEQPVTGDGSPDTSADDTGGSADDTGGSAGDTGGEGGRRPDEGAPGAARGDATPRAVVAGPGGQGRPAPPRRTGIFIDPEDLREHVGGLLRTMLGTYQVDPFGNYSFTHEGARVFVTIGASPMGPHVGIYSVTNIDLDLEPDLASFLATTNHQLGFGTLSYDTDNRAVWLRHTLLGTALDAPELQASVASVARTAASIDDAINQRFGGRTFEDAPQDVQDSTSPPSSSDDDGGRSTNVSGYL